MGCRFLVRFGVETDLAPVTIPLGFVFLALGGFVLGARHWLTPLSIGIFLLCLTIAGIYHAVQPLLRSFAALRLSVAGSSIQLPLLLIAPVIFLNLVWAVAPEIQFDANNYHLAVSKIYLRNHGFIDLPYFFHSYFYHFVEMLFTFGLALRGAAAAKLLSFAFSLIAAAAVFSLGRLVFDERTGIWAAAFFYTTPLTRWLSGTAYIDHAVAIHISSGQPASGEGSSEIEEMPLGCDYIGGVDVCGAWRPISLGRHHRIVPTGWQARQLLRR